jgi:hypothetical protein
MLQKNVRPFYSFNLSSTKTSQKYPLPYDIIALEKLECTLRGYLVATFGSGTPVAKYGSPMASLISTINISRGSDNFKSASPEMLLFENFLLNRTPNVIRATAGASATDDPQTDVTTVPYGTTGQYQNIRENLTIHFCYPHTTKDNERFATAFRTTNVSSANMEIVQNPYLNLRADANTAPVVYSGDVLNFDVSIVEYIGSDAEKMPCIFDYRQEEQTANYTAQTKDIQRIPRLGLLSSIMICSRDGAVGSSTTATDKVLNDNVLTYVKLIKNQQILVDSNFKDLKAMQKSLFQYQAAKVASVARDDGFSGIYFTRNGFKDLVDISQESASVCNLVVDTNSASNVTYTNGCFVKYLVNQVASIKR